MEKSNVFEFQGRDAGADPLTELLRAGAQQLIRQAVQAELQELLVQHSERRTEDGKAGVVRNGYLPERELQTGVGPVTVWIPKVRAKTGEPVAFRSALVPPPCVRAVTVAATRGVKVSRCLRIPGQFDHRFRGKANSPTDGCCFCSYSMRR